MNIDETIQIAIGYHQKGDLQKAETLYKEILSVQPDNFYALHYIGVLYTQLGNYDLAVGYIEKAIEVNPTDPHATYNLGIAYQGEGRLDDAIIAFQRTVQMNPGNADAYVNLGIIHKEKRQLNEAIDSFRKALQINPNHVAAQYNLGYVLQTQGSFDEAVTCYQNALQLNPNLMAAHYNLGCIFQKQGRLDEAAAYFEKALQLNPDFAEAYNGIGAILHEKGQLDEAIGHFQKALQLNPGLIDAYNNLGIIYQENGQYDESIACYKKAIQINPNQAEIDTNLGNAFHSQGKQDEAISAYDRALEFNPNYFLAMWARCISRLPVIYPDYSTIQISRRQYHAELIQLSNSIAFKAPQEIDEAAQAVGRQQPFLLACQGFNDKELQCIYGELICRIMAARYSQFAELNSIRHQQKTGPLRIGIVTKFFYWHSIWKIPLKGWIENLDKKRFHLYGYHTGSKKDHATESARRYCRKFVEDIFSFEELCHIIHNDNLHVLLYPEIGMDPMTLKLSSLRLAPVQCTSLGHPDTSGLPTIDYYLSSDLMEPPNAVGHYTEKLIRFPNLGFWYEPFEVSSMKVSRDDFGLHPQSILYLCSHALFTHLPQYDYIYPRIAQQVNNCQFVFISHRSNFITEQFRSRLKEAFNLYHLDADEYVVILPRLNQEDYYALNYISDIFLDTIGWSSNNSTFEAIACNLPIVTLPGALMRQRHCTGILTMMGVTETIADSIDDYIDLAIHLGKDAELRRHISEKIEANKYKIYHDEACINALENFLEKVVNAS